MAGGKEFRAAPSTAELVKAVWRRLCEPKEQRQFLLMFELVGNHSRKSEGDTDLAQSIVDDWLDILAGTPTRDG